MKKQSETAGSQQARWAIPQEKGPGRQIQAILSRVLPVPETQGRWRSGGAPSTEDVRQHLRAHYPESTAQINAQPSRELYATARSQVSLPETLKAIDASETQANLLKAMYARFGGQMANMLFLGALGGGGMGLASALPAWLKARRKLDTTRGRRGDEEEGELAKTSQEDTAAPSVDTSQLPNLLTRQQGRPANVLETPALTPSNSMWMGLGPLPPGVPAGLAIGGGLLGSGLVAHKFMAYLTDRLRNKEIQVRKEKLRQQFEDLMAGDAKYASVNDVIDDAYTTMSKTSGIPPWTHKPMALLSALALLEFVGGYAAGGRLARQGDPERLRAKAVEHGLKLRRLGRRPRVELGLEPEKREKEDEDEVPDPEVLPPSAFDGMPALPAGDYDEALDLSKMSTSVKASATSESMIGRGLSAFGRGVTAPGRYLGNEWWKRGRPADVVQRTLGGPRPTSYMDTQMQQGAQRAIQSPEVQQQIATSLPDIVGRLTPKELSGMQSTLTGGMDIVNMIRQLTPEQRAEARSEFMGDMDIGALMQENMTPERLQQMLRSMTPKQVDHLRQTLMGDMDVGNMLQQLTPEQVQAFMARPEIAEAMRGQMGNAAWGSVGNWLGQAASSFMSPQQGYGWRALGPGLGQYLGGNGGQVMSGLMDILSRISGAIPGIFGGAPDPAASAGQPTGRPATDLPAKMQ